MHGGEGRGCPVSEQVVGALEGKEWASTLPSPAAAKTEKERKWAHIPTPTPTHPGACGAQDGGQCCQWQSRWVMKTFFPLPETSTPVFPEWKAGA